MSLEGFSKIPHLKDLQSYFLGGMDLNRFFVGTVQYDRSMQLFCKIYDIDQVYIPKEAAGSNPEKVLSYN